MRAVPDRFVRKGPGGSDSEKEVRPDFPQVVSHEYEEDADSERNERSDVRLGIRRHVLGYEKQIREERKDRHLDRLPGFLELRVRFLSRIDVRHDYEKRRHQREEAEKSERRDVFRSEIVRDALDVPMDGHRIRQQRIEVVRRSDDESRGRRAENAHAFHKTVWLGGFAVSENVENPGNQFFENADVERVEDELALAFVEHEVGPFENVEVVGEGSLREVEVLEHFTYRHVLLPEEFQDFPTVGVRKGFERFVRHMRILLAADNI